MSDSTKSMLSGIYEMGKSVREYIDQNGGGGSITDGAAEDNSYLKSFIETFTGKLPDAIIVQDDNPRIYDLRSVITTTTPHIIQYYNGQETSNSHKQFSFNDDDFGSLHAGLTITNHTLHPDDSNLQDIINNGRALYFGGGAGGGSATSNVVSAVIEADGTITSSSDDWIESVVVGNGFHTINFVPDYFTQAPSIATSIDHQDGVSHMNIEHQALTKDNVQIVHRGLGNSSHTTRSQFTIMAQHQDRIARGGGGSGGGGGGGSTILPSGSILQKVTESFPEIASLHTVGTKIAEFDFTPKAVGSLIELEFTASYSESTQSQQQGRFKVDGNFIGDKWYHFNGGSNSSWGGNTRNTISLRATYTATTTVTQKIVMELILDDLDPSSLESIVVSAEEIAESDFTLTGGGGSSSGGGGGSSSTISAVNQIQENIDNIPLIGDGVQIPDAILVKDQNATTTNGTDHLIQLDFAGWTNVHDTNGNITSQNFAYETNNFVSKRWYIRFNSIDGSYSSHSEDQHVKKEFNSIQEYISNDRALYFGGGGGSSSSNNIFGARIQVDSNNVVTIVSQTSDFIESINHLPPGNNFDITFRDGIFTEPPIAQFTAHNKTGSTLEGTVINSDENSGTDYANGKKIIIKWELVGASSFDGNLTNGNYAADLLFIKNGNDFSLNGGNGTGGSSSGGGGGSSSGGGSSTFEDLNDTPSSFVGESGKFVKVNDTEDALEFTTFNVNDALGLQEVDGEDNCSEFHLQSNKTTNSSAFEDSSVNNYSILGSNVIHSTSNPRAGFGSSSIQFNGNGQLLVADGSAFKFFHTKIIKNYTIQLWIFKDALNTREPLLLTAANNNEHGVRLIVDSDNKVKFDVMKGLSNATGLSLASTSTVSAQTWHHIAIVNENNTMTLYLDGNQEQSLAWASDASTITPNFGLSIGAGPMGAGQAMVFFNGRMQDIRVDKIAFRSDLLPPTSLLNATCDPSAGKSNIDFKMLRDTPVNYSNAGGKYVKVKDGEDGVEFVEISVGSSTTNEFSTAYVTQDQTSDGFITDLEFGNLVVGRTYRISSTICFESNDASALSRADFYNGTQRIVSLYNKGLTSTVSNSMLFVASDSSISVSGNGLTSNNFIHGLPELSFVQLELPPSVVVEIEDIPVAPVAPPGGGIFSVNDVKMHAGIIDYQDSSNTFSDIDSNAFGGNIIDVSDIRLISKIDNTGDQKTFEDLDSRLTSIDKLDLADIRVIAQIDYTGHSRTFEDFDSSLTSFGVLSFADMIINTKIYSTGTDSVMTTDPYTSHDHSFSWTGIN